MSSGQKEYWDRLDDEDAVLRKKAKEAALHRVQSWLEKTVSFEVRARPSGVVVGVATVDGSRIVLEIDAFPVNGKLEIREPR